MTDTIARKIDHTQLKPEVTKDSIKKLCKEAKIKKFASVCINPFFVSLASNLLRKSKIKVCAVIGFPLGANKTEIKILETQEAIKDGASEIDMVINIGALKAGDYDYVKNDIEGVVEVAKGYSEDIIVKVIIETGLLTEEEKIQICKKIKETRADFIKTSTGFNTKGATVNDVKLLKRCIGKNSKLKIKASGGIRTYEKAKELLNAGAERLGTSSGVEILKNKKKR